MAEGAGRGRLDGRRGRGTGRRRSVLLRATNSMQRRELGANGEHPAARSCGGKRRSPPVEHLRGGVRRWRATGDAEPHQEAEEKVGDGRK
jgi:hypothetical protein